MTNQRYSGGQIIEITPSLDEIPLFVKAGSIIPIQKGLKHTGQHTDETELHVYPGDDCNFMLYDDDGETYAYENDVCNRLLISWDDEKRALKIGNMNLEYIKKYTFKIICGQVRKSIEYTNGVVIIDLS